MLNEELKMRLDNMTRMSRGLRNNNPGNIRLSSAHFLGEKIPSGDPAFRQFKSIEWGYRAMFVLLRTYVVKHKCHTLRQIINRYAPPVENHTDNYIRRVSDATHLSPDEAISINDGAMMTAIVAAMSEVENGVKANMADIWRGWELFVAKN